MKISCPHCGQHYELDDSAIGSVATCERCEKDFTVGEAPPPPNPGDKSPLRSVGDPALPVAHCPYCGGEIAPGVKKCRHCGEWLEKNNKGKIIAAVAIGLVLIALVATICWFAFNRGVEQKERSEKSVSPPPAKSKTVHPTIGVKHFANPAHSATCVLYKNDREIMRKETTSGWLIFERVECLEEDVFKVEMQYRNGYGTVGKIIESYSRKAKQSNGNVLELEPKWESDREIQDWEKN